MAKQRARSEFDRDVTLAWHIEKFRNKRLPTLEKLLARTEKQTPRQMKATLAMLSDQYGLPLLKVKRKKVH